MAVIFDGKAFADEVIKRLRDEVIKVEAKLGRKLKLVTVYNPAHEASRVYINIKAKIAKELGIEFQVVQLNSLPVAQLSQLVTQLNSDKTVDGVMIQMPLTGDRKQDAGYSGLIAVKKDADGLNPKSGVKPATVRAVVAILKDAAGNAPPYPPLEFKRGKGEFKIIVVGNKGLVGKKIQEELKCEGMDQENFEQDKIKSADIVISCTGQAGLIQPEMVKEGVIAIDVGYPVGDFAPDVALKASFFTPVPGGVGPVTVAMLFANLADLNKL